MSMEPAGKFSRVNPIVDAGDEPDRRMATRPSAPRLLLAVVVTLAVVTLALAGCAYLASTAPPATTPSAPAGPGTSTSTPVPPRPPSATLSPEDGAALTQLKSAAASSADVPAPVERVECWTPSRHLVSVTASERVFRVICRVFYTQADAHRYKDMTCIGDFERTPMLDSCYRWAYYSQMPRFEDGARTAHPPPSRPAT